MAAAVHLIRFPGEGQIKITKWKVKMGSRVSLGALLALYEDASDECGKIPKTQVKKLKATHVGTVLEIVTKEGHVVPSGSVALQLQACTHPTVMKDMCADCGADLREALGIAGERKEKTSASVAMVHNIPELIISEEQAMELGKADEDRLLEQRKLVLLVDLDQTLIHTTNDNVPANLKGVYHFQLWHSNMAWYHTRLRPNTHEFLEKVSKLYELHICTFGTRMYAHTIAKFLDPKGKFFSHRILSRDECFNANSKTANLKALFPCGDSMVCIIDDREDVWNLASNLIQVKPYRFFQGTADINAPPGLKKNENDAIPLYHKIRRISHSSRDSAKSEKSSLPQESHEKGDEKLAAKSQEVKKIVIADDDGSLSTSDGPTQSEKLSDNTTVEQSPENTDQGKNTTDNGTETDVSSKESSLSNNNINIEVNSLAKDDSPSSKSYIIDNNEGSGDKNDTCDAKINDITKSADAKNQNASGKLDDSEKTNVSCNTVESDKTIDLGKTVDSGKTVDNGKTGDSGKTDSDDEMEEWDDEDDYLFYLEDVLLRVHSAFFQMYDQSKEKGTDVPNLKNIIPYIKKKVLKGTNIVFSGVIPQQMVPEKSRQYTVATNLGATVQSKFVSYSYEDKLKATTHVVAAKQGTAKVLAAKRAGKVHIVAPEWLWACNDRWEKVEERVFPLKKDACSSSDYRHSPNILQQMERSQKRKTTDAGQECTSQESENGSDDVNPSKRNKSDITEPDAGGMKTLMETLNPFYSFSGEEIADMDKEVDDLLNEESDTSESEDERETTLIMPKVNEDSSSDDSLSGDFPRGWGIKDKLKRPSNDDQSEAEVSDASDVQDLEEKMKAFIPESDSSTNNSQYNESIGSVDEEMAAAVEREFLSH